MSVADLLARGKTYGLLISTGPGIKAVTPLWDGRLSLPEGPFFDKAVSQSILLSDSGGSLRAANQHLVRNWMMWRVTSAQTPPVAETELA